MSAIARTNSESPNRFGALTLTLRGCVYGVAGFAAALLIHEVAHAVAFKLLFANSYPSIECEFNNWQITGTAYANFEGSPILSQVGELFGEDYSSAIVSAAGHLSSCLISGLLWCQKPQNFLLANPSVSPFFQSFPLALLMLIGEIYEATIHPYSSSDFASVKSKMGTIPASIFASGCIAIGILGMRKLDQLSKKAAITKPLLDSAEKECQLPRDGVKR